MRVVPTVVPVNSLSLASKLRHATSQSATWFIVWVIVWVVMTLPACLYSCSPSGRLAQVVLLYLSRNNGKEWFQALFSNKNFTTAYECTFYTLLCNSDSGLVFFLLPLVRSTCSITNARLSMPQLSLIMHYHSLRTELSQADQSDTLRWRVKTDELQLCCIWKPCVIMLIIATRVARELDESSVQLISASISSLSPSSGVSRYYLALWSMLDNAKELINVLLRYQCVSVVRWLPGYKQRSRAKKLAFWPRLIDLCSASAWGRFRSTTMPIVSSIGLAGIALFLTKAQTVVVDAKLKRMLRRTWQVDKNKLCQS